MVTDLERLLQRKLEAITVELDEAKRVAAEANAKLEVLSRKAQTFKSALSEERGIDSALIAVPQSGNGSKPESEQAEDNKSQIVRDLVNAYSERGIVPKDVKDAFRKAGVFFHPNYPYAVLRRLKKNGTIRKQGERFYPAKEKTVSA